MSFDVFLIPSTQTPGASAFRGRLTSALQELGAEGKLSSVITLADGSSFEIFGVEDDKDDPGAMFALRGLTFEMAKAIFEIADSTSCFVIWPGGVLYRTPRNRGEIDYDEPILPVPDATELLRSLAPEFGGWARYAAQVSADLNPRRAEE